MTATSNYIVSGAGNVATLATDPLTGNVTGLVGPSGALASMPFIPNGGQAAIPVILPSSGTITNGVLSALTVLPTAYGGAWMYFPASASLPSGAGLYWVSSVTTTGGNITTSFANASAAFTPYIPSNPVLITSGGAAYTQTTGVDITLANITVPGGLMGANGALRTYVSHSLANTAGAKPSKLFHGGAQCGTFSIPTSSAIGRSMHELSNRGSQTSQYATSGLSSAGTSFANGASALIGYYGSIDTSITQPLTFTGNIAVATDYIVLEGFTVEVFPRA